MLHLIMTSPIALFLSEITTYIPVNVYRLTISVTVLIPNDVVYADLQYAQEICPRFAICCGLVPVPSLNIKTIFTGMVIPFIKIKRSWIRHIFLW